MRAIMIVGLLVVLLIVGILTIQNMGGGNRDGQTETQTREYIDRTEDATEAVEEKMRGLTEQLKQTE